MWPLIIPLIIMFFIPVFWTSYDVPRNFEQNIVTNREIVSFMYYADAVGKKAADAPDDFSVWTLEALQSKTSGRSFLLSNFTFQAGGDANCPWHNFYHAGTGLRFAYGVPRVMNVQKELFKIADPQFFGIVQNGAFIGKTPTQGTTTWMSLNPGTLGIPEGSLVFAIKQHF